MTTSSGTSEWDEVGPQGGNDFIVTLGSFDDWVRQVGEGGAGLSLSTVFYPLLRVEKLLLDAEDGAVPSMASQFEKRVGRSLREALGWGGPD